jgi:hypothetical protein
MTHQDTGKHRTNTHDQFYTRDVVAKQCVQWIITAVSAASGGDGVAPYDDDYLWVEPSAGTGAFLCQLPKSFTKIGLDIDPKRDDIIKQDYLIWNPDTVVAAHPNKKGIIVFGNPPFGRQSSFAKAFIAKSCSFANIIAFILPKSFTKPSMYNAFHPSFHMIFNEELEKNAFIINGGAKYDVPCVFQIWEKRATERPKDEKVAPIGFEYIAAAATFSTTPSTPTPSTFALRRVGGLAGKCYTDTATRSAQSHYFIRLNESAVPAAYHADIIEKINKHTFPSNTVGPRSLSKSEVNVVLNQIIQEATAAAAAAAVASSSSC